MGTTEAGLLVSSDNGNTWNKLIDSIGVGEIVANSKNIYIVVLEAGEMFFRENKYYNSVRLLKSSDEGNTWGQMKTPGFNNITSIACDSNSVYIGTWGKGIFRSTDDGENWEPLNFGLDNLLITKISIMGNYLFAGTVKDFYISFDKGKHWIKSNEGLYSMSINNLLSINNHIVATTINGFSILISSDNGNSWNDISKGINDIWLGNLASVKDYLLTGKGYRRTLSDSIWTKTTNRNFSAFLVLDTLIFGVSSGIYRSTDFGKNWELLNNVSAYYNPPFVACENYFVFLSDNYPRELDVLPNFYRSKDTCKTFERIAGASASGNFPVYYTTNIACLNNQLFRVHYDYIYRSTDFANSWTIVNNNLPDDIISSIHTKSPFLFIGTEKSGVLFTTDYGDTWNELNDGLEDKSFVCLTSNNEYLFASTKDGWVWRYPIKDIPLNVKDDRSPIKTSIRIYHEPSNSQAFVSFEIETQVLFR